LKTCFSMSFLLRFAINKFISGIKQLNRPKEKA